MNKGMTINQLLYECRIQVAKGNGNKHIQIACDEEGNSFHSLFFAFTDEPEDLRAYEEMGCLPVDQSELDSIILLG